MNYVFRGILVFQYNPETKSVTEGFTPGTDTSAFNFCRFTPEDYKLLAQWFDTVYKHIQGEITTDDLTDIAVD